MKSSSEEASNPLKDEEENKYTLGKDVENFFDSLFNRGGNPNVDRRYLKTSIPDESESVTLKLIHSKLVCFPTKKFSLPPPPKDNESYAYYVPGVKETTSVLFPAFSSLNNKEQSILYRYHFVTFYKIKLLTEKETTEFKELMKKAYNDYQAYQAFVHSQWVHHHAKRVLEIPPGVQTYIDYLWHTRADQCLQMFPKRYTTVKSTIPLTLNDPHEDYAVMDFGIHIFRRGTPQRMLLPSVKKPYELLTDFKDLCKVKPVMVEDKALKVNPVFHQRLPISLDPVVKYCLLKEPNIDVVITPSGIKTIIDTDRFQKNWILPITVKNVMLNNGEVTKKIVIIDKKLPNNFMSVYDKNVWHGKIAAKWALILAFSPHLLQNDWAAAEKTSTDASTTEERQLTQYDDVDAEDCDVFGIDPNPGNEKEMKKCKSKNPVQSNSLDSTKSGVKEVEGDIFDIGEFLESINKRHSSPSSSTQGAKEVQYEQTNPSPKSKTFPSGRFERKVFSPCEQFTTWKLHKSMHFQMLKQEQRTLNVLVRSRLDGNLDYYRCNRRLLDTVYVSSKLEFQPEYGASKIDASQLSREYVDLHLRANCRLARVRSVGHTHEVMLNEIKTIHDIREDLQVKKVKTNKMFDPLYAVLTTLVDLPVGKYMLQHTPKLEAFAHLMVEDPNGQNFNLHSYFSELKQPDVTVPAAQIDPFVLTRIHSRDRIPPALFKPCPSRRVNFFRKPDTPLQGKKRRRGAKANQKNKPPV